MTPPPCDRHKNLQMVPCAFERPTGMVLGHICPVPSCGRYHDNEGYFDVVDDQIRGQNPAPISAREKIMRIVRARAGV